MSPEPSKRFARATGHGAGCDSSVAVPHCPGWWACGGCGWAVRKQRIAGNQHGNLVIIKECHQAIYIPLKAEGLPSMISRRDYLKLALAHRRHRWPRSTTNYSGPCDNDKPMD